jgi:hypothetical protein
MLHQIVVDMAVVQAEQAVLEFMMEDLKVFLSRGRQQEVMVDQVHQALAVVVVQVVMLALQEILEVREQQEQVLLVAVLVRQEMQVLQEIQEIQVLLDQEQQVVAQVIQEILV